MEPRLNNFSLILTDAAVMALKLKLSQTKHSYVRIGISGGSCAGFSHIIKFEDQPRTNDLELTFNDLRVIVDPKSAEMLNDTTIDVKKELLSQSFKFFSPKIENHCGCGKSFSIKGE
jgi:iron-sulfur cluster assembly protein